MARGAQGHDLEGDHGEYCDEDDPAPHSRAVDVERRMEPPIRDERGDAECDQRHDERRTAPVGELLHERGDGAPFVNMFPARGLLLGASGLLALAGGLGCFAARRVLRLARRDVLHLDFHINGLLRTVFGAAGHLHSGTPQHLQNLVVVHRGINPSVFRQLEKWYPLHALGNANGDKSGTTVICPRGKMQRRFVVVQQGMTAHPTDSRATGNGTARLTSDPVQGITFCRHRVQGAGVTR